MPEISSLQQIDWDKFRPLSGRCILHPDPFPEKIGSIVTPESARKYGTIPGHTAVVVAVGHGPFFYTEEKDGKKRLVRHPGADPAIQPGVRVVYRLLLNDRDGAMIDTDIRRIDAVIEE